MAAAAHCSHPTKFQYRCRRCRHSLMYDAAAGVESGCTTNCPDDCGPHSQVWYLQEDSVPPWIQNSIEESTWTRGKLLCPKCRGRLGSFDFTMQPRCPQSLHMLPCVHLVKSRVDRTVASPPVARVRPFQQEEGLWSSPTSPEANSTQSPDKSLESSTARAWSSGTDAGGASHSQLNSHRHMPKSNIPLTCCCGGRQELASTGSHLHAFPIPDRVKNQNCPHACSQGCGQGLPPLRQNWDVQPFRSTHVPVGCTSDSMCVGRVSCCHRPCLSETRPHSEDATKFARQTTTAPDSAVARSRPDTCHCREGNSECNEILTPRDQENDNRNDTLPPEPPLSRGVRRSEGGLLPIDEVAPSVGQEDPGDLLHDWEILEELEELNSSLLSYQRRAEARREKNRRKRIRRKLRKNANQQFLDGDLKSLPPSKFEDVTGISLGDKSIQEFTICAVCLDLFFNPRACSPCGHLFCEQCLRQLTRFNPTSTPCPLCRTVIQVTIPHEGLSKALSKLFPSQMRQRQEAYRRIKQLFPLPRAGNIPSIWLPLFGQQILGGRNRRQMFWALQPNASLDYHDFGRLWVQTLRWRFTVAGYGLLALLLVCACSVLVINFV